MRQSANMSRGRITTKPDRMAAAATALHLMKIEPPRDPATDPQPGDRFRVPGGYPRMVIERKCDKVRVEYGDRRIWWRVDIWRKKCALKEIAPATPPNIRGVNCS